uniref:Uncharacterized protein n=1 Tax=Romanomermis culicivorax TaxID=13658 RepID=A0A915JZE4_ROMCU
MTTTKDILGLRKFSMIFLPAKQKSQLPTSQSPILQTMWGITLSADFSTCFRVAGHPVSSTRRKPLAIW